MPAKELGVRVYPRSREMMLNAIHDLVEMQKAEETYTDIPGGRIHFFVEMYGFEWEYRFAVEGLGQNRSRVRMELGGKATDKADRIRRQFALLDSMLPGYVRAADTDPAQQEG